MAQIAVIGLGCLYPDSPNPKSLWENILGRRRQFRDIPDCRLPLSDYFSPDIHAPDKTYGKKAALIDGYAFDWAGKKIPKSAYESTDLVHWLALDIALQALEDAGLNLRSMPKEKTGVIVGNTLTGEFTRANTLRLRWPYVKRVFQTLAYTKGMDSQAIHEWESEMEVLYKSVFAPVTEDTLAGGLSNTIAGRICNFCDFHGGGYTVDGACSSSLLALISAATALESGDMDLVLAGGVDISLDTFELVGFAKTGALTADEMKVYDKNGHGFIPGEGCGFVALKRLDDAIRDSNPIYATLNGWGISSDGKGGITSPSSKGQATALIRAYEKAGYSPHLLHFIEGHGTGTTVGDRVELTGISMAMDHFGPVSGEPCGVTSFKSIMGHTKAAAGIGAFIKAVIAVNQRIIPPTAGITDPHPLFSENKDKIYPVQKGKVFPPETKLFAGVSAMGFGGINSHVTLSSYANPALKFSINQDPHLIATTEPTSTTFTFAAHSDAELHSLVRSTREAITGISEAELIDFSADHHSQINLDLPIIWTCNAITVDTLIKNLDQAIQADSLIPQNSEEITLPNFSNHIIRPFIPIKNKKFITNPLEKLPKIPNRKEIQTEKQEKSPPPTAQESPNREVNCDAIVLRIAAELTGFPPESIQLHHLMLDDLNLDSIKSAELVAQAAKETRVIGKIDASDFAAASLADVAKAIQAAQDQSAVQLTPSEKNWARVFVMKEVETQVPNGINFDLGSTDISFVISKSESLMEQLISLEKIKTLSLSAYTSLTIFHSQAPIQSWLASIHHENPSLKIRSISISEPLTDTARESYLQSELSLPNPFIAVRYKDQKRFIKRPKLMPLPNEPLETDSFKNTLILVTGGAKGITAECALEWAKASSASLALLGRTPEDDPQIQDTLKRYKAEGLQCMYVAANITDLQAVQSACDRIQAYFKQPISGIIHGAGLNIPRKFQDPTQEEILAEISPKILGFQNLLLAIPTEQLSLVVGISSIIGTTGMPGNAWYAFSNEALDQELEALSKKNPNIKIKSLAFSVWDEVGMGVRMGSVSQLSKLGIGAITKEQGTALFTQLLFAPMLPSSHYVITSRLGGLDTWNPILPKKPLPNRFLETIISFEPGVEVISQAHLTIEKDIYLKDHNFQGSHLFPTVFGLEAMGQAVAYTLGLPAFTPPLQIQNIKLDRPIVVDPHKGCTIQIKTLVEGDRIRVTISTDQSHFVIPHFESEFVTSPQKFSFKKTILQTQAAPPLDIDPKTELYGSILFQGLMFQKIRSIYALDDRHVTFSIDPKCDQTAYADISDSSFILGNPFVRDAMLQSLQLPLMKELLLPIKIGSITISSFSPGTEIIAEGRIHQKLSNSYLGNVSIPGETMVDYEGQIVPQQNMRPSPQEFLNPTSRDRAHLSQLTKLASENFQIETPLLCLVFSPELQALSKDERHSWQIPYFKSLFQDSELEIQWTQNGKPVVHASEGTPLFISGSHDRQISLFSGGISPQGCDIEIITQRTTQAWTELLGYSSHNVLLALMQAGFPQDDSGTIIWSVRECLKKAFGHSLFSLSLHQSQEDYVLIKAEKEELTIFVAALAITLTRAPKRVIAYTTQPTQKRTEKASMDGFQYQFYPTFKDIKSKSQFADAHSYIQWLGTIREIALAPISQPLLADLKTGNWGIVTNNSWAHVLQPVSTLDKLEARLTSPETLGKDSSTIRLWCEWYNMTNELVAVAHMDTTWVRQLGGRDISAAPLPDYLENFLTQLKSMRPTQLDINALTPTATLGLELMSFNKTTQMEVAAQQVFKTSISVSNTVGNLYFGHYYTWQYDVWSEWVHTKLDLPRNAYFELKYAKVDHFREALPFDHIRVDIGFETMHEMGIIVKTNFFRMTGSGFEKLAIGSQVFEWRNNSENTGIPKFILDQLRTACNNRNSELKPNPT